MLDNISEDSKGSIEDFVRELKTRSDPREMKFLNIVIECRDLNLQLVSYALSNTSKDLNGLMDSVSNRLRMLYDESYRRDNEYKIFLEMFK